MAKLRGEVLEVNSALTRKVAHLARLELSEQEVETFTSQLGGILNYVGLLQQVDVSQVEPLTHPLELATPLREDIAKPSPLDSEGRPKVLQSAPDVLDDGFKVPPIL
jgi:aspartyl-tRNA(Asn)/glutamyl-tRNA(Gln) amidotransferase subunit C